jgi:hypothetical protein
LIERGAVARSALCGADQVDVAKNSRRWHSKVPLRPGTGSMPTSQRGSAIGSNVSYRRRSDDSR